VISRTPVIKTRAYCNSRHEGSVDPFGSLVCDGETLTLSRHGL